MKDMINNHLSVLIHRQAEKYGDRVALKYRDYDLAKWIPISWNEFSKTVSLVANALVSLGVEETENIGVFSQNKPECLYVDFGAYANRAVVIPFYATSSPAQVQYMVNDAQIRFLFVGEQYQYDAALRVMGHCHSLKQIVIFDPKVVKDPRDSSSIYFSDFLTSVESLQYNDVVLQRTSKASGEDLANILYTSGTTGEPKGVMLHHSNFIEAIRIHRLRLDTLSDQDISMNFLPLTHIFERGWTYICLERGTQVCVNLIPQDIQTSIKEIRPTVMCSVPRFWEKVYLGVLDKIESSSGVTKQLMLNAIKIGREHNNNYVRLGLKPPRMLHLKYKFYEKTVMQVLKKTLGVERGHFFPTAGAALPVDVAEFIYAAGINVITGYGLTESTATVSCTSETHFSFGSVGYPLDDVQVKIGDQDEILLRGKTITKGYYNKSEETAKVFDADGWFRTGDIGYIKDGELFMTGRLKDLFKTSNGKYIAPQALETKLVVDKFIDQVTLIADGRKFVSALIVPIYDKVEAYAKEHNISYNNVAELIDHPDIYALYRKRIHTLQQQFASYEQIKNFTLLKEPFSMKKGELTNTLKIKRNVVANNYKDIIDKMYEIE